MLTPEEKRRFGIVAWTIHRKGHLPIDAILRFTKDITKKDVKKFIRFGLLKKHHSDTYEMTHFGMVLGFRYNERFGKGSS